MYNVLSVLYDCVEKLGAMVETHYKKIVWLLVAGMCLSTKSFVLNTAYELQPSTQCTYTESFWGDSAVYSAVFSSADFKKFEVLSIKGEMFKVLFKQKLTELGYDPDLVEIVVISDKPYGAYYAALTHTKYVLMSEDLFNGILTEEELISVALHEYGHRYAEDLSKSCSSNKARQNLEFAADAFSLKATKQLYHTDIPIS